MARDLATLLRVPPRTVGDIVQVSACPRKATCLVLGTGNQALSQLAQH